jgi:hypothetical protein
MYLISFDLRFDVMSVPVVGSISEQPSERIKGRSVEWSFVFTQAELQKTCRYVKNALCRRFGKLAK